MLFRLADAALARAATWGAELSAAVSGEAPLRIAGDRKDLPAARMLRCALRDDPSQEYFLYIPSRHDSGTPLFVTVHGISRNALEHATLFQPYAEEYGVVLAAPLFTKKDGGEYQTFGRGKAGRRSDETVDQVVEEVARRTGVTVDTFYLFGFSGGAQFAHRYAMAHPDRIAAVAVGSPGWYTFPDSTIDYPYGIGHGPELEGLHFDPRAFLRVPMSVFVGGQDVTDEHLRRNPEVDQGQGATRVERARRWAAAMHKAAADRNLEPRVTCEVVPGIQHSFSEFMREGRLGDRVFQSLFGARAAVTVPAGGGH